MAEKFSRWLETNGGCLRPELNFFQALPGGDRGVVAQEDIKKGEVLVCVPLSLCIHMPTEEECAADGEPQNEAASFLRSLAEPLNSFLSTVLLLMHELSKASISAFAT